jgi:hypothetical protein
MRTATLASVFKEWEKAAGRKLGSGAADLFKYRVQEWCHQRKMWVEIEKVEADMTPLERALSWPVGGRSGGPAYSLGIF